MNNQKLFQTVHLLLERELGNMNYMKLIKLLYIADKRKISSIGTPITGDTYCSMKNGPVLSGLLDFINQRNHNIQELTDWNELFEQDGQYSIAIRGEVDPGTGDLSKREKALLNTVFDEFREYTPFQMVDYIHNEELFPEVEWREAERLGTSFALTLRSLRLAAGMAAEEVVSIEEEERILDSEAQVLGV